MKITRKGRKYDYDYKLIHLKEDIHEKLKVEAKKHNLPMGKFIGKLLNDGISNR